MNKETKITSAGIKRVLKNYKYTHGFAEFIWNGFDAKAKTIEIKYDSNELGIIHQISIRDDGNGINLEKLENKFAKFYDSEKTIQVQSPKHSSVLHGKNGVGRLTFFTFCANAEWDTVYLNEEYKKGIIRITSENLKTYKPEVLETNIKTTGTTVKFTNISINQSQLEQEIIPYLKREFCWFLELNKSHQYTIIINGKELDYTDLIYDQEEFILEYSSVNFAVRFIQWKEILNKEYSKFYYLDQTQKEIFKDFTTLNKKGDHFYHSVFISSGFFKDFDFTSHPDITQENLFMKAKSSSEYKFLNKEITSFLKTKRKPFLREYASVMIENYELDGVFPEYQNSWEVYRKNELKDTIISLYEAQPKVFSNLNIEQKKTFVRFLDLLLDSNEREHILEILEEITNLEPGEREEFASMFKSTRLDRIVSTIKLIEDRFKTYYSLKELVYNESLKANEVDHLQTLIENNYWFFGEQYHLITAAEPKFEEALRRYIYKISDTIYDRKIDHIDKNKEMDIFACRQNRLTEKIENIVLELKHPNINLGSKEYLQVMSYLNVINKQPEFNGSNMDWRFYLVGRKFDSSKFIEGQINTNKPHGEKGLVYSEDEGRIKFYVKTWNEIFTEFELKHTFIDEKLKLERASLYPGNIDVNEIVENSVSNSAISLPEIKVK